MHKIAAAFSVVFLSLLFIACGSTVNEGDDPCTTDSDCVPQTCCHATACGAPSKVSDCNLACTADCQKGTLDCGGSCFCDSGRCAAHLLN